MTKHFHAPGSLGMSGGGGSGLQPGPLGLRRRERAKALKATDARALLQASLPFVLEHMTEAQVQQMQMVLDAAVVDPAVQKEAQDLNRRSIVQSGPTFYRDMRMVHRAEQVMESFITVTAADKRIRLDFTALLEPGALQPRTDNPDEAAYLEKVRQTLTTRGVWLRFAETWVRDPDDPSRHFLDGRTFEVWLSLGPGGDAIPTKSGRLTRDSLLGTTLFGAGYYDHVDHGAVQAALDREIRRLQGQIQTGLEQHQAQAKIRRNAFFGVAEVSDFLGGADFPDTSIWDQPHQFVLRGMEFNVGGNVKMSQAYLVVAAVLTRNAAKSLADYIDDTASGAERAVTVLKVAKTAGEIAQIGLAVTGLMPAGFVRGGAAVSEVEVDAAVERYVKGVDPAFDELRIGYARQPKGSVGGNVKAGHSSGAGSGILPFWRGPQ